MASRQRTAADRDVGGHAHTGAMEPPSLDLSGRVPDHVEDFSAGRLDQTRWWPYYTPHWLSRAASAARYEFGPDGITLRIDENTAPWSPEFDGELRSSTLQTGQLSGPLGSRLGQHRYRDDLRVREEQPDRRLWQPHFGVIEVRMRAIRHPDAMVAFWPIGVEERPEDSGEICIAEIFGADLDDTGGWVGVGVKPQNDPRLRLDFEKIRVEGDLTQFHDYAVDWQKDALHFFIDGRRVKTPRQRIDYPVQFMLNVYEFARPSGVRDAAALPHRFDIRRVRTFPRSEARAHRSCTNGACSGTLIRVGGRCADPADPRRGHRRERRPRRSRGPPSGRVRTGRRCARRRRRRWTARPGRPAVPASS